MLIIKWWRCILHTLESKVRARTWHRFDKGLDSFGSKSKYYDSTLFTRSEWEILHPIMNEPQLQNEYIERTIERKMERKWMRDENIIHTHITDSPTYILLRLIYLSLFTVYIHFNAFQSSGSCRYSVFVVGFFFQFLSFENKWSEFFQYFH